MIEKTTRMNYLFDFYQVLLTPKQQNYMALYYLDDYSLGEIAEEFHVSRQAVYDNIKRTEAMLEEYESKLHLFEKYQRKNELIDQLSQHLAEKLDQNENPEVFRILEELKELD